MKVTDKEIVEALRLVGGVRYDGIANRIEAHGIEQPSVDALIAEAVAKEREACAKIAMEFWCDAGAEAIRARGQK